MVFFPIHLWKMYKFICTLKFKFKWLNRGGPRIIWETGISLFFSTSEVSSAKDMPFNACKVRSTLRKLLAMKRFISEWSIWDPRSKYIVFREVNMNEHYKMNFQFKLDLFGWLVGAFHIREASPVLWLIKVDPKYYYIII